MRSRNDQFLGKLKNQHAVLPVFFLSIKDSVNPQMLVVMLVFLTLIFAARTKIILRSVGSMFILMAMFTTVLAISGLLDKYVPLEQYELLSYYSYRVLAILFFIFGIVHFKDWMAIKKTKDVNALVLKPHLLISNEQSVSYFKSVLAAFFAFVFSVLFTWLCFIKPIDSYFYYYYVSTAARGMPQLAKFLFFVYAFGFNLVLLVVFALVFQARKFLDNKKISLVPMVTYVKIIASALFFACSVSLFVYLG